MKNLFLNLEFVYDLKNNLFFKMKYCMEKIVRKVTIFLRIGNIYFFKKDYVIKTKEFQWNIKARSDFDSLAKPNYEPELMPYFQCSGIFVDIGAHIGRWSLLVSKTASHVYSFEANPETYKYLLMNIASNHIDNITAFNEGVSSASGKMRFFAESPEHSGSSKIAQDGGLEISTITLDSLKLPAVDLMKIDVEGHELEVLKGAEETLGRTNRVICEIWHDHPRRQEALDFMEQLHFQREVIDKDNFFFTKETA
jgi:FkbM family methyltransferase